MEWSTKVKRTHKRSDSGPSGSITGSVVNADLSEFKTISDIDRKLSELDIDRKLSELQCPFTWPLPRTGIVPKEMVSSLTGKDKELEGDEFKIRNFICNILIVYELYNDDKLEEANKKLITALDSIKDFYNNCEDEFFVNMKKPLQHIMLSCKVHLLKAYLSKLKLPEEPYLRKIIKILKTVYPYSEMTESEQAGIYGFKAQVFSEYGYSGAVEAVEYSKKAMELDPKQAEWHFLTGKLMGRIRRCANWNEYVKKEEIKLLEQALELCEKPSYMVYLASAYVDFSKSIKRNLNLDNEMKDKLLGMNTRAKELYMKALQLNPDCPHLNIRCASGLLKLPKHIIDKDVVEKYIKVALEKAPNNGFVNHVAGMFAERHEYDFEKALRYYKISSDLGVYGAMADYIRLKYVFENDYDLIGALENMLEYPVSLPDRHKTLSCIGSYYLFLKRDLFRALNYYGRIMDEDSGSSAVTANKPLFLAIQTPVNMYEILYTEVHLELNKNELKKEEICILKKFLNKLSRIDPEIVDKFADKPSRIQQIVDESRISITKYKAFIRRNTQNMYGNARISTNRARGREYREVHNVRQQINTNAAGCVRSWRDRESDDTEIKNSKGVNAKGRESGAYNTKKNGSHSTKEYTTTDP